MSAIAKTKLKAAKEAISKKDWNKAKAAATDALDYEPDNYHANIFLAYACLELGEVEHSEQTYLKASNINPDQALAWQGLSRVYESSQNWEKYIDIQHKLAELFSKSNDGSKCAEALQRLIDARRKNGTPLQLVDALSLLLPNSAFYPVLSTLPPPDATNPLSTTTSLVQAAVHNSLPILEEIVAIVEKHENGSFTSEVAKRRTRLTAGSPEQVKREVGLEVWGASRLPALWDEIIAHPHASDELRRATEAKLLEQKQQLLYAIRSPNDMELKLKLAAEVNDLVDGIVLLNIPNQLAWNLAIESKDAGSIKEYDLDVLFRYVRIFPTSPLAKLLSAYFAYSHISVNKDENTALTKHEEEEDHAEIIMDVSSTLPNSIIAHRIAAETYGLEGDLENAIRTAEDGLELVSREEQNRAIKLPRVRRYLNVILGTALVHLFPPKHHTRALRIIDDVLAEDGEIVPCLMGRGYILQYAKRWEDARKVFVRVTELLPDDLGEGIRAREEAAWCQAQAHDPDSGAKTLHAVVELLDSLEDRELDQARCWWRLGKCQWELGDNESRESAYRSFITALKRSSTYAPAFTSLGIYYAEFISPPDPNRASKCFQKAFELDPREADAARRLAEGFAEERDWDLVEVVARRTIEGEGGDTGAAAGSKFQPLNAWAWKALGIVELTRRRYSEAISALQVALRSEPEDQLCWLRLGEAYSKAFRLAPALKALEKARELDPDDWKCLYFLGEVHRQSGQFQQAIEMFASILAAVPSELSVLLSLAQTHLECGRSEKAAAYTARAESSFVSALQVIVDGMDANAGFRRIAWKTAADALYELSLFASFTDPEYLASVLEQVLPLAVNHPLERLKAFMEVPPILGDTSHSALSRFILEVAICAYSYRMSLGSLDNTAAGSAAYDLGVSLRAYATRLTDEKNQANIQEEAIRCLKEAIGYDPLDDRYWLALAGAYFLTRPKLAQHAYVKALEIDSKNFVTWSSLGLFYLYHADLELAKEAFNKAQVLNPDFGLAWIGHALIAVASGHDAEASSLFEHVVTLSESVPEADVAFAKRTFDAHCALSARTPSPADVFYPSFFVMDRYVKQRPQDATGLHLFALICERVGHVELGIAMIGRAIALLETAYEESEDPVIERQYTIAHVNMGRLWLSFGDHESALQSYEVPVGLLAEPQDDTAAALLLQAHLGSGLASFKIGNAEGALTSFETAAGIAVNDLRLRGHAVVLLAQALWALGTDEGREAAKSQLLQSIDSDPDNLMAINTLAGMGILTDDDSLLDAALSEILALPLEERHQRDPSRNVTYLLAQHHLAQGEVDRALSVVQKAVVHEPSRSESREQLAFLTMQRHESTSARAILGSSAHAVTEIRASLGLQAIAEAHTGDASARSHAEKAVFLTPWDKRNWQALAYCSATPTLR